MTTQEVANNMVNLWRQGKGAEVQETMYSVDAKSIEPNANMFPLEMVGLDAVSYTHLTLPTILRV